MAPVLVVLAAAAAVVVPRARAAEACEGTARVGARDDGSLAVCPGAGQAVHVGGDLVNAKLLARLAAMEHEVRACNEQ